MKICSWWVFCIRARSSGFISSSYSFSPGRRPTYFSSMSRPGV